MWLNLYQIPLIKIRINHSQFCCIISRNGVISEVNEDAQSITVKLRLWGGQPSDDVTVIINLPDSDENSLQLVFAPGEWHQTKSVTFTKSTA